MSLSISNRNKIQELLAKARAAKASVPISPIAISPIAPTIPTAVQLSTPPLSTQDIVAQRLAAIRANKSISNAASSIPVATLPLAQAQAQAQLPLPLPELPSELATATTYTSLDKYGNIITFSSEQAKAIELISRGKSCIVLGAAGTGKTSTIRGAVELLMQSGLVPPINDTYQHKYISKHSPGIIFCAYTRNAVTNIKKAVPTDLQANCITIHKLLEYSPVSYEIINDKGEAVTTRRFEPLRSDINPLPGDIKTIVIDESSMVAVELYDLLMQAIQCGIQVIFVGDINQLPPVFGSAILGYKMLELPTIELTEVHRQALNSPIIRLAHKILSGIPLHVKDFPSWCIPDQLTLREWKRSVDPDTALLTIAKLVTTYIDEGIYNPEQDMILLPYNKACGTIELNKRIANHLARKSGATTYEVIAGFIKHYYSVGDCVLYDKEEATISSIEKNPKYIGAAPQQASTTLDYWGHNANTNAGNLMQLPSIDTQQVDDNDIDNFLASLSSTDDSITREASHMIKLVLKSTDAEIELSTASEINKLLFSWALTVHKSQGSEWRKVFLFFHKSHATMVQRELLYTAVTRAREELFILCEPTTFVSGILNQRIKGNNLAEKAEFFKGKIASGISTYIPSGKEL